MKHLGKTPKWLDTTTGKVCGDESTPSSSSLSTSTTATPQSSTAENPVSKDPVVSPRKPTARKSTSRSVIRVAMFRCGDFFSIRECTAADEDSPASSGTSAELSADSGISQSDSVHHRPLCPLLCCDLCSFTCRSLTSFASHLRTSHTLAASQRIKILTVDDPATPRRCGLCSFQTLSDPEFSDHVSNAHQMSPPLVCSVCYEFASFAISEINRHSDCSHPDISPEFEALSAPYSMSADLQSSMSMDYVARDASCTLNPVVSVTDIADMSQVEFSNLLDHHAVWFDYWSQRFVLETFRLPFLLTIMMIMMMLIVMTFVWRW